MALKSLSGRYLRFTFTGTVARMTFAAWVAPPIVGVGLGALTMLLGLKSIPLLLFSCFILPWLVRDPVRLFLWLLITWPVLTLFIRIHLPAGIPDVSYDRVMVLLLLYVVTVQAILQKRELTRVDLQDIFILLYAAAQFSSRMFVMLFGGTGSPDLNGLLDIILIPILLYWLTKNLLLTKEHLRWFLFALLITCLVICLTGLYEQAMGVRIFKSSVLLGGTEESYNWQDVPGGRAAGAMGNPAIYGAVLGFGILAGLACLFEVKKDGLRLLLWGAIALMLFGVLASYTRSAWGSVLIVLVVAQFFIKNLWKKTIPLASLMVFLLILFWNRLPMESYMVDRATTTHSLTSRFGLISLAFEKFIQKPFFGWGTGAFNQFGLDLLNTTSHNIYLTFLVDGGLVLLVSFCLVVGMLLWKTAAIYPYARKTDLERHTLIVAAGGLMIFLISGFALELRYFAFINALFWICAGVVSRMEILFSAQKGAPLG